MSLLRPIKQLRSARKISLTISKDPEKKIYTFLEAIIQVSLMQKKYRVPNNNLPCFIFFFFFYGK